MPRRSRIVAVFLLASTLVALTSRAQAQVIDPNPTAPDEAAPIVPAPPSPPTSASPFETTFGTGSRLPPPPLATAPSSPSSGGAGVVGFDPSGTKLPEGTGVAVRVVAPDEVTRLRLLVGSQIAGYMPSTTTYHPGYMGAGGVYMPGRTTYSPALPIVVGVFLDLCVAPCELRLLPGAKYVFDVRSTVALGYGGAVAPRTRALTIPEDVESLHVRYERRDRARRRAWIAVGVMPLLGALLTGISLALPGGVGRNGEYFDRNNPLFWTGITLLCTPVVSYTVPLLMRDRVSVHAVRRNGEIVRSRRR